MHACEPQWNVPLRCNPRIFMHPLWLGYLCAVCVRSFILCFVLFAGLGAQADEQRRDKQAPPDPFQGFRVDLSQLNKPQQQFMAKVLAEQIELIKSTKLPPIWLSFMKTIPIVAEPGLPAGNPPVLFTVKSASARGMIQVSLIPVPSDKPVLLHEMLHAYDWNYWRFGKPQVLSAYEEAVNQALYPQWRNTQFLSDAKEFFAVTGTVYLTGSIKQAPFDCENLSQLQPAYVSFLAVIFGRRTYCD
jgi:hypothetical protein